MTRTRITIGLLSVALLAGCSALRAERTTPMQPVETDMTGTGSSAIAERLLPGGILEVGDASAPVSLLVFTNYECTYCAQFQHTVLADVFEKYVKNGTVRLSVMVLPITKYPESEESARLMLCAAREGKGWATHGLLFDRTAAEAISQVGLQNATACMAETWATQLRTTQGSIARTLDVTLVPTYFINGKKWVGLPTISDLSYAIDVELGETK